VGAEAMGEGPRPGASAEEVGQIRGV
jgi:hypothetical protein